ncbi:MAG: ATP-binding protein [Bacteroidales bacterium]|nr:ATP-binding protein [Bacteroidales bacterium]
MKFYDRETETDTLQLIESLSAKAAQMTVVTGRRRIGKTALIKHSFARIPFIYFFVVRKSEALLCSELQEIVRETTGEDLGEFTSFARLFRAIMNMSKRLNFTLVLDEFQNLQYVDGSLFSEIQNIWDSNKDESHINLVLCGSVYSMMAKIFDDAHEPLYGRATHRINLRPFRTATLKEILADHNPAYQPDDLLALYMLTGGVAKYVELIIDSGAYTKDTMIEAVLSYGSHFITEGYEMLREEFGKEYANYFSVLQAIAEGNTERGRIKSAIGIEPGGYLDKLEKTYGLVARQRPWQQHEGARDVRYCIIDNFLTFWFRFVYKYRSAVEIDNMDYVRAKVQSDYNTFSGLILERYFRQQYAETGLYNVVSNYWHRDADEIDLVAVNEADKQIVLAECKRQAQRINLDTLREKSRDIVAKHRRWQVDYRALSLADM